MRLRRHNGFRHCLGCGYILNGLPEARCPECGRGFDPDDPATYSYEMISGAGRLCAATASALIATTCACLMIFVGPLRLNTFGLTFSVLRVTATVGAYFIAGALGVTGLRALCKPDTAVQGRRALVASVVVCFAVYCLPLAQLALLLIPASKRLLVELWLR